MPVLIATVNQTNVPKLLEQMNLTTVDTIVINQSTTPVNTSELTQYGRATILNSHRLGLSASRNDALALAPEDAYCYIADDDLVFEDNCDHIIENAFKTFPDADIIAFIVGTLDKQTNIIKGRVNYLTSMKLSSVQLCYKKSSFTKANITFDERFGIGSTYSFGEENIMLFDALKKGLKIYCYPEKIATLTDNRPSYWDRTITEKHLKNRGAVFKRMSPLMYWLFILQYGIRKRHLFPSHIPWYKAIHFMFQGAVEFAKTTR